MKSGAEVLWRSMETMSMASWLLGALSILGFDARRLEGAAFVGISSVWGIGWGLMFAF